MDLNLTTIAIEDPTSATPLVIDTRLADLYGARQRVQQHINSDWDHIVGEVARHLGRGWKGKATREEVHTYLENAGDYDSLLGYHRDMVAKQRSLEPVLAEINALNSEYSSRPWTRAYLAVTNSNGHVHSTMDCSTCFYTGYDGQGNWRNGTQFQWLVDLADHDESEIIEKAGERACTVCYPHAPVGTLSRPTQIFSKSEIEKQAARAEREAKRQAKLAAEIHVPGYQGYGAYQGEKVFKTERAVTNDIASNLYNLVHYGTSHPTSAEWMNDVAVCREALAAKGVDFDYEKCLETQRKKYVRESKKYANPLGLEIEGPQY